MKDYKKYFILEATPDEVYLALTNPLTIHLWSGEEAVMSTEPGSDFSLWEGSIIGKNLVFEQGRKIVQQWYFDGVTSESIVTLKLHSHKKGTSVELTHTNIPDDDYEDMVEGWNNLYFASLTEFYQE